jgi:hypothetical protein
MADAPMGPDDRSPSMHQGSKRRRSSLASLYNSGGGASDDLGLAGMRIRCIGRSQHVSQHLVNRRLVTLCSKPPSLAAAFC